MKLRMFYLLASFITMILIVVHPDHKESKVIQDDLSQVNSIELENKKIQFHRSAYTPFNQVLKSTQY